MQNKTNLFSFQSHTFTQHCLEYGLGYGLGWDQGTMYWVVARISSGKGAILGEHLPAHCKV